MTMTRIVETVLKATMDIAKRIDMTRRRRNKKEKREQGGSPIPSD